MDELTRRMPSDGVAEVVSVDDIEWDVDTDVLVAGGGGTGLVAALAASESPDARVAVLEKAPERSGSTSLSTGMVPAAGTRLQREVGAKETPADMTRDILEKNDYEADEECVQYLCEESVNLIRRLVDNQDITLHIAGDFKYSKHSEYRMHALEGRNGENLVAELVERVESASNVELLTSTPVKRLVAEGGTVRGVVAGPGHDKAIEAEKVILATDGFAGDREMIINYCEEDVERAPYFGTNGNTGDGVRFGTEFGSELACMDAYQGRATMASQTGVLSTYTVTINEGILVSRDGERSGDESAGYSEFAISVFKQPGEQAIQLFDERIFEELRGQLEDFDDTIERGTYHTADSITALAERLGTDGEVTAGTVVAYNEAAAAGEPDEVSHVDGASPLEAPFYGAKVTDALFHTQGDLVVDEHGHVFRIDGDTVENLYIGGGTTYGISGHGAGDYPSGNGLAIVFGYGRLVGIRARGSLD